MLPFAVSRYSFLAVAKSAAGIGVPNNFKATRHAPCVFFYVVAQAHPFSGLWCLFVHQGSFLIMVVRAGQPSGWPVPL
ncbi:ash family protein, partial [Klebsiella michiganensis]|uniref:ash family protein n=1 Tax=Klebsiella michiganensis TaxID=1134687 RepID=UPI001EF90BD3